MTKFKKRRRGKEKKKKNKGNEKIGMKKRAKWINIEKE